MHGWSDWATLILICISLVDEKSKFAWIVVVRFIISKPCSPTLGIYLLIISYLFFGIILIFSRSHLGRTPIPIKFISNDLHTSFSSSLCVLTSLHVSKRLANGAPDNSNWPPGSSVIDAPFFFNDITKLFSRIFSHLYFFESKSKISFISSKLIGERSLLLNPNFSCSVPTLHLSLVLQPL